MPHIHVSMYPGTSEADKQRLAIALQKTVVDAIGVSPAAVSVRLAEVQADEWLLEVYNKDIRDAGDELFVPPGYTME